MAMTASLSMNPTTVVTEGNVSGALTVSNSAASAVQITNIVPFAYPSGASASNINSGVSVGPVNIGPNVNLTVPASGSLIIPLSFNFHAPQCGSLNGTVTGGTTQQTSYKVGATCYSNDGSVFVPTEQTVTVNNAVTFSSEQD